MLKRPVPAAKEGALIFRATVPAIALTLSLAATGAWAHHAFANIDKDKTETFAATVRSFDMINPHSWLQVTVPRPGGRPVEWSLEMGDPSQLTKEGWTRQVVRRGDKVTVTIHPMLDGSHGGQLMSIVLANGRTLDADKPAAAIPRR